MSATVTLDGGGSRDMDGDTLGYAWSFTSVPEDSDAMLLGGTSSTPSFVTDATGTYVVQLIVNDGALASQPSTATIHVADDRFTIREAEWSSESGEFEVEGRGNPGDEIEVAGAGTGQVLGTAVVGDSGSWALDVRRPNPVPCAVRASSPRVR